MSIRGEIRQHVANALSSSFISCFAYRPSALDARDLPACAVYFEGTDHEINYSETYTVTGILTVEIWVAELLDIDAALDAKADIVNAMFSSDITLGGLVSAVIRQGVVYDRDPESATGTITLTYQVIYEED